jgi:NAD-dependent dihydropyrimidine dehydrogenase PreA subunit
VAPCAEGAIQIIDGKAKVMREELCDGAGFCIGVCPTGALTIEEREAVAFDEHAAEAEMEKRAAMDPNHTLYINQSCHVCGAGEDSRVLLPCRKEGQSLWVCTRCLPVLIHG